MEYNDVSCEIRGAMVSGRLQLTSDEINFKAISQSKQKHNVSVKKSDLEMVNWQRLAGTWGIRLFTKEGTLHRFAGFRDSEHEKLAKFFTENYSMDMLERELAVKGWNWGSANFKGSVLSFEVGGKNDAFEVPLSYVSQCLSGKNEATLEFNANDETSVMLTEMRFHIPPTENEEGERRVEKFVDNVLKCASNDLGVDGIHHGPNGGDSTVADVAIAIFREIHCLSPRGRYDIKIFTRYFHLHGKTFDYKISVSSVIRLFLLPDRDQRQMLFVVNVDPPIKQGQTRYHHLVFNFKQEDEEEDIDLPISEEELKEKYDGKLEKNLKGPTYEVIAKLIKAFTAKKVTGPGSFVGNSGSPAVACSHKAASGFIYPMERGLMFVYKPPIHIRYDEIRSVNFERSGVSTRSFDIEVATSTANDISYTFSSIEKGEYTRLYDFLKSKKIKVVAANATFNLTNESSRGYVDHHLEKVKADAEEDASTENESMSSDDEEFNPDTLEALSAKEEYDSEPSDTSSAPDDNDSDNNDNDSEKERKRKDKETRRAARKSSSKGSKEGSSKVSGDNNSTNKKSKKKVKLPGQPKRNMSAYFLFMNENREDMKAENPNLSVTDLGKKAGEMWKALTDKSKWESLAVEDKKRYDAEMADWLENGGGKEAIKQAKKDKRAQAKKASTGSGSTKTEGGGGGGSKKLSTGAGSASTSTVSATSGMPTSTTAGSGSGFKSKEFIEDSDSPQSMGDD